MQNQHTRELISARNKHSNKDPSRLRYLSHGMHVITRYINSSRDAASNVPLVEFMYVVFTRVPGESLPKAIQVFVVVLVSSAD